MPLVKIDMIKGRSDEEIRTAMSGVICRCTGYVHTVEAVKHAIATVEGMPPEERKEWFPV